MKNIKKRRTACAAAATMNNDWNRFCFDRFVDKSVWVERSIGAVYSIAVDLSRLYCYVCVYV